MNKIFWGLIFMFFSFTFNVDNLVLFDFLPDFVGYLLIESGFNALGYTDIAFRKQTSIFLLTVFAIYNFVTFMHVIAMPDVSTFCYLLTMYFIYQAVHDSEQAENELHANNLRNFLIASIATSILLLLARLLQATTFIFAIVVLDVVLSICYTVTFHQTKNLYVQRELSLTKQQESTKAVENSTDIV